MKRTLQLAVVLSTACLSLALISGTAQAQKIDLAFGVSTPLAPSANQNGPSLTGGAYPGFSGDVLFWHNLGFGAEVFWRASQAQNYEDSGFNIRPVFYNFNAVYSAKIVPHVAAELVGGLGALDNHVYACNGGVGACGGSVIVQSSNHFDVDFGGGLKLYAHGGFFVRPEARFYWINNNTSSSGVNYSSSHATRVGASIGYTFK